MAVSNHAVINKMMVELQQAKQHHANDKIMKKHISHVQLLCDLLLQSEEATYTNEISEEEMKAMLGKPSTGAKKIDSSKTNTNHDGANGNSIFDF